MIISTNKKVYVARYLGIVPYHTALKLQEELMRARAHSKIPDILLLMQHPPVITLGRFRGEEDIIAPPHTLNEEDVVVFHTNRGGGSTCHSPGQLIGYPIINIKENGLDVRGYIWRLEVVIINLLLALHIQSCQVAECPGVWVGESKVCSIGIHVSRYITTHGFALNVSNDLRYFEYIRPCGLSSKVMTSVSELLGYPVEVETVIGDLLRSFSETFNLRREQGEDKWLAILDAPSG